LSTPTASSTAAAMEATGALSRTLYAYADADMNALQAAKKLAVHSNTIYSRLQKIADLTGRNALRYHDLTELLLALECSERERANS
jgi:carbohydrate diacid regulator